MTTEFQQSFAGSSPTLRTAWRDVICVTLAAIILLGPAVPQLLGEKTLFLRSWKMYGYAGNGLFKGVFTLHSGAEQTELTPLQVLRLPHYPSVIDTKFIARINVADPARALSEPCAALAPGERLAFDGWRGTRDGWRRLTTADICSVTP